MPSKRSKSKEREKKRRARDKRSDESLKLDREKAREGMRKLREKEGNIIARKKNKFETDAFGRLTKEGYVEYLEQARVTMRRKRANQTEEEKENDCETDKERKRAERARKTEEEKEKDCEM